MVGVLDGYCFHVLCRIGLAAHTPAMQMGEIGFDTDTKVFRIGNDSAIPEKIMCSNSNEAFAYPFVPSVKFNNLELYPGGKVAGVDLTSLRTTLAANGPGLLSIDNTGKLSIVTLTSGNSTVSITNPDGMHGNPDLRVSAGGGLSSIVTDSSITGDGLSTATALSVAQATTNRRGGAYVATVAEALSGVSTSKYVTPAALYSVLQNASTIGHATDLTSGAIRIATPAEVVIGLNDQTAVTPYTLATTLATTGVTLTTSSSFGGNGSSANPLTLAQSTLTQLGGVMQASDADATDGTDFTKYISPAVLRTQLLDKASIVSPAFTGAPTTTTPISGDSTTRIPNTAWVRGELNGLIGTALASLNTLGELGAAINNDPSFYTTVNTALSGKVPTTRSINTASPLMGGGSLTSDLTISFDTAAFDALYASTSVSITGAGLITGGGDLSSNRVLSVTPATSAQALALSRNDVVITPSVLKDVTDWLYSRILAAPPAVLDTIQEIGESLGNDPNFATTMASQLASKVPVVRTINTTAPLQGGGILTADLSLTFDAGWSDGRYASLSRSITAAGLATGGGNLSADRTITVTASTNAQAVAGTDTTTAMTPASTKAAYLPLVGGTVTGAVVIDSATSAILRLDKNASGDESGIGAYTNGVVRWINYVSNSTSESGANAGSDYELRRYSDAGTYLGSPLIIKRDTGSAYFDAPLYVGGIQVLPGTYPASSVVINAAGLATGGGNLTADRTITVTASTNAQAIAGTDTTTAMTPASTAAAYLPLVGGSITGNLTVNTATSPSVLLARTAASTGHSMLVSTKGGLNRWAMLIGNNTAEGGANSGSDFQLLSFDDAGGYISAPIQVSRATGATQLLAGTTIGGSLAVVSTRSVLTGGLATGGGNLSADRTITVTASTNAQAIAGTDTTTAVTPAALEAAFNARYVTQAGVPASPKPGMVWHCTTNGTLNMYMHDGTAYVWVQIA